MHTNKEGTVPVIFIQRRAAVIAYCPIFDLLVAGQDIAMARENFVEALEEFLERVNDHGLIEDLLHTTGWNLEGDAFESPRLIGFEDVPVEFHVGDDEEDDDELPCH